MTRGGEKRQGCAIAPSEEKKTCSSGNNLMCSHNTAFRDVEARSHDVCRAARVSDRPCILKIIGRSWLFREGERKREERNVDAKQPPCASLRPPLNAGTSCSTRTGLRAGMTLANRAELRGESEREKGGRARGFFEREKDREKESKRRKQERERERSCACLGAKSWASRAQAWPRLTLRSSRSEVILEHEPPSGSQPPPSRARARVADE